ncbi:MAG: flagellar biosynthetic protein FliR [Pseudomonadota bacterium]
MTPPSIDPAQFIAFCLILLRVSTILFLMPIFGSNLVPNEIKMAFALILSLALLPVVKVNVDVFPTVLGGFIPLVLGELFMGLTLGMMARAVLESVQLAGQYIGFQMGFAIANVIDPQSGAQASVISQLAYIMATLIFLALNGHHFILTALVESFELAPAGSPLPNPIVFDTAVQSLANLFIIAIKIGAPTLALLFFAKVAMGIVSKTVPQLNVLFVGMPLDIVLGLFLFGISLSFFVAVFGQALSGLEKDIGTVLRAM